MADEQLIPDEASVSEYRSPWEGFSPNIPYDENDPIFKGSETKITEEEAQTPISTDAYKQEVSNLLDPDSFWEIPYEEKVKKVRQVFLGEDLSGKKSFEDEQEVTDLHKQILTDIREYDGKKFNLPDILSQVPEPPEELKNAIRNKDFKTIDKELDAWEATTLMTLRSGGLRWKEIEDIAEPQLADYVDKTKNELKALQAYGEDPNRLEWLASNISQILRSGGEQLAALVPGEIGDKLQRKARTATETIPLPFVGSLPMLPPASATGEQAPTLRINDEIEINSEALASGVGSGTGFMGVGAAGAMAGGPLGAFAALVPAAARAGYAEGYDKIYRETGDRGKAIEGATEYALVESADALISAATVSGMFKPLTKAISQSTKVKAISEAINKGLFGKGFQTGFREVTEALPIIAGEAGTEYLQEKAEGEIVAAYTGEEKYKATPSQLTVATLAGGILGVAGAGANVSTNIVQEGLNEAENITKETPQTPPPPPPPPTGGLITKQVSQPTSALTPVASAQGPIDVSKNLSKSKEAQELPTPVIGPSDSAKLQALQQTPLEEEPELPIADTAYLPARNFNQEQITRPDSVSVEAPITIKNSPPIISSPVFTESWGLDSAVTPVNPELKFPEIPKSPEGLVSPTEVIDLAAEVVKKTGAKVPIREASLRGQAARRALGTYEISPEVIRTKTANDIPVVFHEIAHAIDFNIWGYSNPFINGWPSSITKELTTLGKDLYGDTKPTAGYRREGFAEFMKFYGRGNDTYLQKKSPQFYEWFNSEFKTANPEVWESIQQARNKAIEYYSQSDENRIKSHIATSRSWIERVREVLTPEATTQTIQKAKQELTDFGEVYDRLEKESAIALERTKKKPGGEKLLKKMGITITPEDIGKKPSFSPYKIYKSFAMVAKDRVTEMVNGGMIDIAGNRVEGGVSLREAGDIIKSIKKNDMDLATYLYAKRAIALHSDPIKGPRNPGIPLDVASRYVTQVEAETPEMITAAQKVYQWQEGLLDYVSQASPEFAQIVKKIRAADPGSYIPLQREFRKIDDLISRSGKPVTDPKVFRRLAGSGRRTLHPIASMINNAEAMVAAAHKRMVIDSVMNLSQIPGMGHMITEVNPAMVPAVNRSLADLITTLESRLGELKIETVEGEEIDKSDLTEQLVTFFTPAFKAPNSEVAHFTTTINGKRKIFEMNNDLYEAMAGMDPYTLSKSIGLWSFAIRPMQMAARTFRLGTTALNPGFALYSNPLRDLQTAFINTRQRAGAGQFLLNYGNALLHGATDIFINDPKARNSVYDLVKRLGLEGSNFLGDDFRTKERAVKRVVGGRTIREVIISGPRDMIGVYAQLLSTSERATRTSEVMGLLKEAGIDPSRPITLQQAMDFMTAYKEVTTNFTAGGRLARAINSVDPFFNAAIQGPRAFLQAAKRDPKRVGLIMLSMSALALANWWKNKDEEWWEETKDMERYLYTWIPFENPMTGAKEIWKIPRPYEAAGVSMALTEAMADAFYHENPEYIKGWMGAFFEASSPVAINLTNPLDSTLVLNMDKLTGTLVQLWMNRDEFWKRSIIPRGLENAPTENQFNEYTSDVAKFIGGMINASPMKVDFAIRNLAGGAPLQAIEWVELMTQAKENNPGKYRPFTGNDTIDALISPIINRALAREGQSPSGGRSMDKFYNEIAPKIEHDAATSVDKKKDILSKMVYDARRSLGALRDLKRQTVDREERRKITEKMNSIVNKINSAYEKGDLSSFGAARVERRMLMKQAEVPRKKRRYAFKGLNTGN